LIKVKCLIKIKINPGLMSRGFGPACHQGRVAYLFTTGGLGVKAMRWCSNKFITVKFNKLLNRLKAGKDRAGEALITSPALMGLPQLDHGAVLESSSTSSRTLSHCPSPLVAITALGREHSEKPSTVRAVFELSVRGPVHQVFLSASPSAFAF
jgi:hypothetical protein